MKIGFYGAAKEVTGSKHLVTLDNGTQFLLDCGLFQGSGEEIDEWNKNFGFDASKISYVILSHAHIDHSGLLPKLVKEGFKGKIYCTPATKDVTEALLEDSASIQESDIKFVNKERQKNNLPDLKPLYDIKDVNKAISQIETVAYDTPFNIDNSVQVLFLDNGHILGSASVNLVLKEKDKTTRLTFTGDIGRYNNRILRTPQAFPQADIILTESTYGDKIHDPDPNLKFKLLEIIEDTCIRRKGKLIIPAFSVGRTQELLSALNDLSFENKLPKIKTYVDSPLSERATDIMETYPECYNDRMKAFMKKDPDPFGFKGLTFIQSKSESQALNERHEPCIIISASGMAEAGRVKHHILHAIVNSRNTILMVGYCSPYSLGGKLVGGAKEVKIFRSYFPVKAQVKKLNGFSAHGDYVEMLKFLSSQNPSDVKKVFLVHGDENVMHVFKNHLNEAGFQNIYIPNYKEEVAL
jgi:metallo-beta-lactamase family protein